MKTTLESLKKVYTGDTYVNEDVLATSPVTSGKLEFFSLGRTVSPTELTKEYANRGLVPAGVVHLAEWTEEHEDKKYVATQWQDENGERCFATCDRWNDARDLFLCPVMTVIGVTIGGSRVFARVLRHLVLSSQTLCPLKKQYKRSKTQVIR